LLILGIVLIAFGIGLIIKTEARTALSKYIYIATIVFGATYILTFFTNIMFFEYGQSTALIWIPFTVTSLLYFTPWCFGCVLMSQMFKKFKCFPSWMTEKRLHTIMIGVGGFFSIVFLLTFIVMEPLSWFGSLNNVFWHNVKGHRSNFACIIFYQLLSTIALILCCVLFFMKKTMLKSSNQTFMLMLISYTTLQFLNFCFNCNQSRLWYWNIVNVWWYHANQGVWAASAWFIAGQQVLLCFFAMTDTFKELFEELSIQGVQGNFTEQMGDFKNYA